MFIVGIATAALAASLVRVGLKRRKDRTQSARPSSEGRAKHQKVAVALLASATAVALMVPAGVASAAIVPTVELGTADNYAVLAGSTVTNTGPSVLNRSLGLSPGTSVIGFPPGLVNPPGTIDIDNEVAEVAQLDLTAAYVDAADRPLNFTTNPDLVGLVLVGGVYAAPAHGPLGLTGQLTLDGEGDPNSVFIFQTDSTLITGSGSSVNLINGAQGCNVFWQVGSSATLGSASVFVGNILALTSITVTTDTTVQGRALARNGAVTLDSNTFVQPTCDLTPTTTTTTTPGQTTTTTTTGGTTSTTTGGTTSTTAPGGTTSTTAPGGTTTTTPGQTTTSSAPVVVTTSGVFGEDEELPLTGVSFGMLGLLSLALVAVGLTGVTAARSRPE